jgi:hypothetical protein
LGGVEQFASDGLDDLSNAEVLESADGLLTETKWVGFDEDQLLKQSGAKRKLGSVTDDLNGHVKTTEFASEREISEKLSEQTGVVYSSGRITKFAHPRYLMFETRDTSQVRDEYGRGLEDITFRDISSVNSSR